MRGLWIGVVVGLLIFALVGCESGPKEPDLSLERV
jgi:hypothetical protein